MGTFFYFKAGKVEENLYVLEIVAPFDADFSRYQLATTFKKSYCKRDLTCSAHNKKPSHS